MYLPQADNGPIKLKVKIIRIDGYLNYIAGNSNL